ITRLHAGSGGVNGFRRVGAELDRQGLAASMGLVRTIMRELGIFGNQPRIKKAPPPPPPGTLRPVRT
ncbi:hypothetical protein DN550_35035, partial [Burkholderia multivorans]